MEKINLNIWHWVIITIVIIAVATIIFLVFQNNQTNNPILNTITPNSSVTENTTTPETTTTTEPESIQNTSPQGTKVTAASISYANALIKYADRRIQLDTSCQAHPSNVTYKDNTGIMIDNRSPKTRTVKVGTTFTIKPYEFKIIVLPDIYLKSKTILVDCDQSQNVATILIQE
ncbi:MAG: hypothetical protein WCX30_01565 [Candidatus Paceibacterota bacterium]|jgi:cytoskeletal protein RodZ|nr:hypothetical protein [bacterium]